MPCGYIVFYFITIIRSSLSRTIFLRNPRLVPGRQNKLPQREKSLMDSTEEPNF